jgi:tripartite-type tricarboxylate transporter receptor subunit TctC
MYGGGVKIDTNGKSISDLTDKSSDTEIAQNLKEYVALAKTKQVTFGSAGIATSTQLSGEKFKMISGSTGMQHIPYRGSALAMQDVIAGQIDSMFEQLPTTLQQIQAGNVRPLAVTSNRRSPELPDVPTVAELGYPGFESLAWFTLSVPAKTSDAVVLKLNKQLNEMLKDKEIQKSLKDLNLIPVGGSPKYAANWYMKETTQWNRVIDFANVSADF